MTEYRLYKPNSQLQALLDSATLALECVRKLTQDLETLYTAERLRTIGLSGVRNSAISTESSLDYIAHWITWWSLHRELRGDRPLCPGDEPPQPIFRDPAQALLVCLDQVDLYLGDLPSIAKLLPLKTRKTAQMHLRAIDSSLFQLRNLLKGEDKWQTPSI